MSLPKRMATDQTSDRYVNREFSWIQFNRRVLAEAANTKNPLLERLKFLAIFESNLDEFYMVRVSGLIEQYEGGVITLTPDGLTPGEQLTMIAEAVRPLRREAADLWNHTLRPELERAGIELKSWRELSDRQQTDMAEYFRTDIFPVSTPILVYPVQGVPFISNLSLNLAVLLKDGTEGIKLARVKVPTGTPRAIRLNPKGHQYLLLEDLIQANLQAFFPGVEIVGSYRFRVIRDADFEIKELEASDLRSAIEQSLFERRMGAPVMMEVERGTPTEILEILKKLLSLDQSDVFEVDGLLGMDVLHQFARIDKPALRYPAHTPFNAEVLSHSTSLFEAIRERDILVHLPFDSFHSIETFVSSAATDPAVVGIKQTLYRVGAQSPIIESLLAAAEAGKQVAVLVELKARFDEINNLAWARELERKGVHVSYGFPDMKVHCKLCSVVRRESGKLRTYAHISTGNYNPATARSYTDLGLLTADTEITQDVNEVFNYLTGFSRQTEYRKLLVAPHSLRDQIIERIEREVTFQEQGRIIIKLNALVDPESIDALYAASQAGVEIDLIVRGACCLRPGVPGMSERIRVKSIVGRFLEHSRIYYFGNGGKPEAFIGSSDLMRRNLDRRIEVLVPIKSPALVAMLHDRLLETYMRDNTNSWLELSDGEYERVPDAGFSAQEALMKIPFTELQF
ncbi:MAG: polyphosphate kinase 1 [Fimbriimonadaceae bacterium]|nr:polyphosphate kinase 1 [Fimbriimonadaceae bacterium]